MLKKILYLISVFVFSILALSQSNWMALIGAVIGLLFVIHFYRTNYFPNHYPKWVYMIGIIFHLYITANLFRNLMYSEPFRQELSSLSTLMQYGAIAGVTLFLSLISAVGNLMVVSYIGKLAQMPHDKDMNRSVHVTKREILSLLVLSTVIITFLSKSSFLYPLNNWVDANCFLTVGKSIFRGKVPYLDLREQKGPMLYFVYALASLISFDSFLGAYFIEILALFFTMYFVYKTMRYFTDAGILVLFPLCAVILYSCEAFAHGGSAEELCIPFFAYTLYVLTKSFINHRLPNRKESIFIGLCAGFVFWVKYTMAPFFLGAAIVMTYYMAKEFSKKELQRVYLYVFIGLFLISLPVFIYYGINQGLGALFKVYFYDNMFIYTGRGENTPAWFNVLVGAFFSVSQNFAVYLLTALGLVSMFSLNRKSGALYLGSFLVTVMFIYFSPYFMWYYGFVLSVFAWFGLLPIYSLYTKLKQKFIHNPIIWLVVECVLCGLFAQTNWSLPMLLEKKENLPQYKFKDTILSVENPTLLNYGFLDGGFYTVTGIVPNCWSFNKLNIVEVEEDPLQKEFVEKGLIDFVVTMDEELDAKNYKLVDMAEYMYEKRMRTYRLYKKIEG
ncbi:MAG: glycosyltransferase family 39 protein [Solobacterium sp.]|nr:glycosyltransferase family 39 protein [Solobacterium sp.]